MSLVLAGLACAGANDDRAGGPAVLGGGNGDDGTGTGGEGSTTTLSTISAGPMTTSIGGTSSRVDDDGGSGTAATPADDGSTSAADTGGGDTGGQSGSGTGAAECGNGIIEGDEECDGEEFGGLTCADVNPGRPLGELRCEECQVFSSDCERTEFRRCFEQDEAIPDGVPLELGVNISSQDIPGVVVDVEVELEIEHGNLGDLEIQLEHDGAAVVLHDNQCVGEANLSGTYTDAAEPQQCTDVAIVDEFPPIPGPEFSTLAGLDGSGRWDFTITDNVVGTQGILRRWCLDIDWE